MTATAVERGPAGSLVGHREDAERAHFDAGPDVAASYDHLRDRGMAFDGGVLRDEGRALLDLYRVKGGVIYNG